MPENEQSCGEETPGEMPTTEEHGETPAECGGDESPKLSELIVEELQQRYLDIVERPTRSSNKRYLVWKITQAQKGKIPVGPISRRRSEGQQVPHKVVPIRLSVPAIESLDEAWKRRGFKSRMEFFRQSLHQFLVSLDEGEAAEHFGSSGRNDRGHPVTEVLSRHADQSE